MLEQSRHYEAEEPIYKCRWCDEKDMRERLASGIGIDEERVKKAMYDYAHNDEESFVEFMDKSAQK